MISALINFINDALGGYRSGGFSLLLDISTFSLFLGLIACIIGMLGKVKQAGLFG